MEIDEKALHKLINEQIERIIAEYADPRNKFIDRVDALLSQLVENWCLVHYCTITNNDINQCKSHWRGELRAILMRLSSFSLKGNDSLSGRIKALNDAESLQELLTNEESVYFQIRPKFEKEGINLNNEELHNIFLAVIKDLIKSKDEIISIIAQKNYNSLQEYINTI